MPERFDRAFQYFISPAGNDEQGDGTAARPFHEPAEGCGLGRREPPGTVARVSRRSTRATKWSSSASSGPVPPRRFAGSRDFPTSSRRKRPPIAGDGTEDQPWPDLETALARLVEAHSGDRQRRQLRPGDRLQLKRREVFAASAMERRKARVDQVAKIVLAAVTGALVLPLVAILPTWSSRRGPRCRGVSWSRIHRTT